MIQPDIDIAAAAAHPAVQALDLSMFGRQDLVNLVLQRSEVLFDLPRSGRIIKAWSQGDEAPMQLAIDTLGPEIARRAAGVIHAEYLRLAPTLRSIAPQRVADIGCGYGLFDLFAARDLGCSVLLIDLEDNGQRHFGFQAEGAAYSNLRTARALLLANGIAPDRVRMLNPSVDDPAKAGPIDMVWSFIACGFHFPIDPYLPFLHQALAPGGVAIFDLRRSSSTAQAVKLETFGALEDLPTQPKARRVLLRKEAA
jgi:SAM-dependent methyltransferase